MRHYILLSILLVSVLSATAQQIQTSSLYDMQGVLHNPSTAGVQENAMVGASYKSQWSGISGGPKTATVFGSVGIPNQNIGIGGYLFSDKTGPTSRTGIQLAFAKHIPIRDGAKFSLGIEAKGQQYSIDKSKLTESLGADPVLGSSENKFVFDAGFGISYTDEKFQVGASVSQLVQSKLNYYSGTLTATEEGRLYRHYFFHGLYKWKVDENTTITPNFIFNYLPNAPLDFLGGVRVEHNEVFWWGLGLRARQSVIVSAGVHVKKKFTIGYSFDVYKTPISVFDSGADAHEILLKYNFLK